MKFILNEITGNREGKGDREGSRYCYTGGGGVGNKQEKPKFFMVE
jgi:hypothetical protein